MQRQLGFMTEVLTLKKCALKIIFPINIVYLFKLFSAWGSSCIVLFHPWNNDGSNCLKIPSELSNFYRAKWITETLTAQSHGSREKTLWFRRGGSVRNPPDWTQRFNKIKVVGYQKKKWIRVENGSVCRQKKPEGFPVLLWLTYCTHTHTRVTC